MKKLAFACIALFAAMAIAACGSDSSSDKDGGKDPGKDAGALDTTPVTDTGPGSEGIILPDVGPRPDGTVVPDTGTLPQCDPNAIGKFCTPQGGECGENAACLQTSETGGVCTCPCIPDDPATPLQNEDTCPGTQNVCGSVELNDGSMLDICFQTCQPTLGANTCQAPMVCDPRTAQLLFGASPVCVISGCTENADCPITTGTMCDTQDAAQACPAGETCLELTATGTKGVCTMPGTCDLPSGLCGKHATDKADAKVGDPCKSDKDCGEYMSCEMEIDRKELLGQKDHGESCAADADCCGRCGAGNKCEGVCTVHARNGYCLVSGCAFATASAWNEFSCPDGSVCNTIFSGGICMKGCDLADASTCRGLDGDLHGDYECRAWSNLALASGPIAAAPVCDFGDFTPCTIFGGVANLSCASLGVEPGNTTNMKCRNITTGAELADNDPLGFCLDDTASGPVP